MDTRSNNDDTTTTEYDSGGSEGVDYAYKGQQVQALPAAIRRGSIESSASQRKHGHQGHGATTTTTKKERSPKRRTSPPRANSGKTRTTPPNRCDCGRPAKDSDGESTASTTTDFSSSPSDTEDEAGPGKHISTGPRKSRPSMSGLRDRGRTGESYSKSYEDHDDYLSDRDRDRPSRDCGRKCCRQTKQQQQQQQQKKTRKYSNTATSSSATKKKKTPYIEEYPEEIRPVVLLKEHKLPRGSFSSSNDNNSNLAKNKVRAGTDDPQQMSSSLGKIQTMGEKSSCGKRPTWPSSSREEREKEREREREREKEREQERSSSQSSSDPQHQQQSRRRRQHGAGREHGHGHSNNAKVTTRHEVPGGKFSGSDLDDDDDDDHDYSSDSSSDGRDLVRHHDHHDRPRRPSMVRRNSRNQPEPSQVPSTVSRSSAARTHSSSPKYSSSWPLQRSSSHYDRDPRQPPTRQHRIIHEEPEQIEEPEMDYDHHTADYDHHTADYDHHTADYDHHAAPEPSNGHGYGYDSGDESDDIFTGEFEFDETTHRRKPRRPPSPPPAAPTSIAPTDSISRRDEHMHRDRHRDRHHQYSSREQHQQQQVLHRQPSQHLEPIHHEDDRDRPRRRTVKAPRPPIARTVVSHRPSMGALDQGIDSDRAGAYASSTTDIWRGRPEDWESPYSSSSDREDDGGYDDGYYGRGRGGGGGDDAPAYDYGYDHTMLIEGDRHRSRAPSHVSGYHMPMPRSSSPQLLPPRRSGDLKSVFSLGFNAAARRDLSPVGTHLSRRTRAGDAADEHTSSGGFLMPPAPSTRGGGGGRRGVAAIRRAPSRAATERSRWTVMVPEYDLSDYGYSYGGNDYGIAYSSPPPAPAPTTLFEEEDGGADGLEGYYSYGFAPSIRVQAPSPPLRFGGRKPPACAMTEEEEMEYGYGGDGDEYGRASGGLLSPVPTRTAAARFNFDKSWSELSRLLL